MNTEEIDWDDIYPKLLAFTHYRIANIVWYKGANNLPKGYKAEDLVMEAINRFLNYPDKFDGKKGNLINYLKFNVINSLISQLRVSAENKTSTDTYEVEILNKSLSVDLDSNLDITIIKEEIEKQIEDDTLLYNIFYFRYYEEYQRSEICDELGIATREYDNTMRRLRRIVEKILNTSNYERAKRK